MTQFATHWCVVATVCIWSMGGLAAGETSQKLASHPRCRAGLECSPLCSASRTVDGFLEKSATVVGATLEKPPWWRTCAVVGSSGLLLSEKLGSVIDSHDAVFRANYAPFVGFEAFVGSKTTVRVANHNITGDQMIVRKRRGKGCDGVKRHTLSNSLPALTVSDALALVCLQSKELNLTLDLPANAPKLTTGMLAIAIALHVCEYVTLFGFDTHEQYLDIAAAIYAHAKLPYPYHYYDSRHPGHETVGFKNDSTQHVVPESTHDIAAEDAWRAHYYRSNNCQHTYSHRSYHGLNETSHRHHHRLAHHSLYRYPTPPKADFDNFHTRGSSSDVDEAFLV